MKVGDLVKTTTGARRSLDHPELGYGCVTKVHRGRNDRNVIVYVCWFNHGHTKPYNAVWLEVISEKG